MNDGTTLGKDIATLIKDLQASPAAESQPNAFEILYAHHFQVIRCPQFSPRFEILAKVKVLFRLLWLALTNCTLVSQILHRNGWVHRDISYGNIMLDERGHTRLIDFEFAKKIRDLDVPEFRVVSVRFDGP